jgi:hypothetical protein
MDEDRPAEDDDVDAEPDTAASSEPEASETEPTETEPTETEPAEPEPTDTEPSETEESPAPAPAAAGGIPATTTTGDREKDVGGPSVTEEARRTMEGDEALEEPGYGDLGHAEDFDILRDD